MRDLAIDPAHADDQDAFDLRASSSSAEAAPKAVGWPPPRRVIDEARNHQLAWVTRSRGRRGSHIIRKNHQAGSHQTRLQAVQLLLWRLMLEQAHDAACGSLADSELTHFLVSCTKAAVANVEAVHRLLEQVKATTRRTSILLATP